jgi:DNA-binding response OmpR family regulator
MHILVFEDNLIWSERLRKTISALGHQATVISRLKPSYPEADIAILNFGSDTLWNPDLVRSLKSQNLILIGHAGHKEKQKLAEGREAGIDHVVTNSELTFKLDQILQRINTQ